MYAEMCGWTLARAHARSGDAVGDRGLPRVGRRVRPGAWPSFAEDYADQNELDYAAFRRAIDSGRIQAEVGL